jgi:hypothetical protein
MPDLKEALRRAGLDELTIFARNMLAKNGTPAKTYPGFIRALEKRRDLLGALALDYLERLAVTPTLPALQAPAAPRPPAVTAVAKSVKVKGHDVGPYHRARPRSEGERRASIAAAAWTLQDMRDRRIGDQAIGDFSWGELMTIYRDLVNGAASSVWHGLNTAADALLIQKLIRHVQVDDLNLRVRDVVSADVFAKLQQEALTEAPRTLKDAIPEMALSLSKQIESHV